MISRNVYAVTLLFILIMDNKAKHLNAESCISSSAYYDRPDRSTDFNYLNNIKESITSNYYNETSFKNNYENNSNFSVMHLKIRSVVSHFTEFIFFFVCCFLYCNLLHLTKVEGLLLPFLYIHTCVIFNKCIQT